LVFGNGWGATAKFDDAWHARFDAAMRKQLENGFWGVTMVARGDKVIFNEGYGLADRRTGAPMLPQTIIDTGSIAKQVTAAGIVLLEAQGKLSVDDRLDKYFDKVPADKRSITIAQLLSHTAGFGWVFPDDFTPIPRDAWLKMVFEKPLEHRPGEKFHYSNDGFTLASMIIEKASGVPFRDYIRKKFFDPLGMTLTGWYDDDIFDDPSLSIATGYRNGKDDGAPHEWSPPSYALIGNGGIIWPAADILKWHRAIFHGDILPESARKELFTPVIEHGGPAERYYAFGWNIGETPCGGRVISHTGTGKSHTAEYRYYEDQDILVYVGSNKIDVDYKGEGTRYSAEAAEALTEIILEDCKQRTLVGGRRRSLMLGNTRTDSLESSIPIRSSTRPSIPTASILRPSEGSSIRSISSSRITLGDLPREFDSSTTDFVAQGRLAEGGRSGTCSETLLGPCLLRLPL
jgi:CubicO group peptidase (beta-lactamase class C family)